MMNENGTFEKIEKMELDVCKEKFDDGEDFPYSQKNLRYWLAYFVNQNSLDPHKVAKQLGWSISVWNRIVSGKTCPTKKINEIVLCNV